MDRDCKIRCGVGDSTKQRHGSAVTYGHYEEAKEGTGMAHHSLGSTCEVTLSEDVHTGCRGSRCPSKVKNSNMNP